jgi:hypothetical protein
MTQESEGIHLITRADTKTSKGTWLGCYDRIKKNGIYKVINAFFYPCGALKQQP